MTVTIFFHGDSSVGISSYSYSADIPDFEEECREETRKDFKDLYTKMDGEFIPVVWFSDERQDD